MNLIFHHFANFINSNQKMGIMEAIKGNCTNIFYKKLTIKNIATIFCLTFGLACIYFFFRWYFAKTDKTKFRSKPDTSQFGNDEVSKSSKQQTKSMDSDTESIVFVDKKGGSREILPKDIDLCELPSSDDNFEKKFDSDQLFEKELIEQKLLDELFTEILLILDKKCNAKTCEFEKEILLSCEIATILDFFSFIQDFDKNLDNACDLLKKMLESSRILRLVKYFLDNDFVVLREVDSVFKNFRLKNTAFSFKIIENLKFTINNKSKILHFIDKNSKNLSIETIEIKELFTAIGIIRRKKIRKKPLKKQFNINSIGNKSSNGNLSRSNTHEGKKQSKNISLDCQSGIEGGVSDNIDYNSDNSKN